MPPAKAAVNRADAPAAAAEACALAVVVDVLVVLVLERLRGPGLGAHPADCLEAEPDGPNQHCEDKQPG